MGVSGLPVVGGPRVGGVWGEAAAPPLQHADRRLMDGANEFLQLMHVCSVIMETLCHSHSG